MGTPTFQKIPPIVSRLIPPEGSTVIGQTVRGDILYERTRTVAERVPVLDNSGVHVWKKHPTTAEPMYPLYRNKPVKVDEIFYLYDPGNGNVQIMPYVEPTKEELAAEKRAKDIEAAKHELAAALVDEGMSAADLVRAMSQKKDGK